MSANRGFSSYFLFSEEQRSKVVEELQAAEPGRKLKVGDIAKAIGAKWKALSAEEKKVYTDRAAELAQKAGPVDNGDKDTEKVKEKAVQSSHTSLPVSIVKRIITCDKDVVRVSGDCVRAIGFCAELFVEFLTVQALESARKSKRKMIRLEDFEYVVKHDKRLGDVGLKDILLDTEMFAKPAKQGAEEREDDDEDDAGNKVKKPASKKAKGNVVQGKEITSFFKSG